MDFPGTLRVASYNIYKAKFFAPSAGSPRQRRSPRGAVLEDVAGLDVLRQADLLGLQEAIVGPLSGAGSQHRDTVAEIGAALGVQGAAHVESEERFWSFYGSPDHGAEWGVGIVSRYPARFRSVALPKQFWSPWRRGALLAEVGPGPLLFATVHLEVWPIIGASSRRQQLAALLVAVDQLDACRDCPVILAGDFNCQPGTAPHRELVRRGFQPALDPRQPTFRLPGLALQLDHIYVRGVRVLESGVEYRARGSDHWPVWARVEI